MMDKWAVFEIDADVHVVPCDKDGHMKRPHLLDEICICEPEVDPQEFKNLIIHRYFH